MAFTRSPLTLAAKTTGTTDGRTVMLRKGACTRFSAVVTGSGSTKFNARIYGSIDGTKWNALGSAATTGTSTGAFQITSTSATAYQLARVRCVVPTPAATSTGTPPPAFTGTIKASVIGY